VFRKPHFRLYRARMKHLIRQEKWEQIVPYRRTSGWMTW
jgi:hypothetical protein